MSKEERDSHSAGKQKRPARRDTSKQEVEAARQQGVPAPYYEEMKEIFKIFDADGSGAIDPKEIREQMISLGFSIDNTTIYQLITDLDSDGSQKLEFDEFFVMLRDTLEIHKPGFNSRQNYDEIFDFLDDLDPKNRDGKIDAGNLRRLANVLGDDLTDKEIELMVQGADRGNNGHVLPEDFYQLMVGCAERMEQEEYDALHKADDASDTSASEPATPQKGRHSFSGRRSMTKDDEKRKNMRRSLTASRTRELLGDSGGETNWRKARRSISRHLQGSRENLGDSMGSSDGSEASSRRRRTRDTGDLGSAASSGAGSAPGSAPGSGPGTPRTGHRQSMSSATAASLGVSDMRKSFTAASLASASSPRDASASKVETQTATTAEQPTPPPTLASGPADKRKGRKNTTQGLAVVTEERSSIVAHDENQ